MLTECPLPSGELPHPVNGLTTTPDLNAGRPVLLIPAVMGGGAPDARTRSAAAALHRRGLVNALGEGVSWGRPVLARRRLNPSVHRWSLLLDFSERLADRVSQCLLTSRFSRLPLVIGGDHSCAVGTWSGVARALRNRGGSTDVPQADPARERPDAPESQQLGLLWVDAHLDAHTPRSSRSKQAHGMPLAMLLGEGPRTLTGLAGPRPVLDAARVVVLGARSWEPAEARRLSRLGVRVMTAEEVRSRGLAECTAQALELVRGGPGASLPWGLSLDVDAIDPVDAPATGTPVPGGLSLRELIPALAGLARMPGLQALEMTEYNPRLDPDCTTAARLTRLLAALLAAPPLRAPP